jgi:hypothetical protein
MERLSPHSGAFATYSASTSWGCCSGASPGSRVRRGERAASGVDLTPDHKQAPAVSPPRDLSRRARNIAARDVDADHLGAGSGPSTLVSADASCRM